jgi:hypothetical protein
MSSSSASGGGGLFSAQGLNSKPVDQQTAIDTLLAKPPPTAQAVVQGASAFGAECVKTLVETLKAEILTELEQDEWMYEKKTA